MYLSRKKKKKAMWKSDKIEKITNKKSKYFKKYTFLGGRHLNVTPGRSCDMEHGHFPKNG